MKNKTRAPPGCTAIGCYYMMHPLDGCYMPTAPCKNKPRRVWKRSRTISSAKKTAIICIFFLTDLRDLMHRITRCRQEGGAREKDKNTRSLSADETDAWCRLCTAHAAHSGLFRSLGSTCPSLPKHYTPPPPHHPSTQTPQKMQRRNGRDPQRHMIKQLDAAWEQSGRVEEAKSPQCCGEQTAPGSAIRPDAAETGSGNHITLVLSRSFSLSVFTSYSCTGGPASPGTTRPGSPRCPRRWQSSRCGCRGRSCACFWSLPAC